MTGLSGEEERRMQVSGALHEVNKMAMNRNEKPLAGQSKGKVNLKKRKSN